MQIGLAEVSVHDAVGEPGVATQIASQFEQPRLHFCVWGRAEVHPLLRRTAEELETKMRAAQATRTDAVGPLVRANG